MTDQINPQDAFRLFGEDAQFWLAVLIGAILKWLLSPKRQTVRQDITGIISGAALAYYGDQWVIRTFDVITEEERGIVIIALVFMGEHVVRYVNLRFPDIVARVIDRRLGPPRTAAAPQTYTTGAPPQPMTPEQFNDAHGQQDTPSDKAPGPGA